MTVEPNSIDLPAFLAEHLQRAEPDLLRSMLHTFVQALMWGEADAICGPPTGSAARSGPTPATASGPGTSTPAPAPWRSRSPSCARAPTSPTGCSSAAGGPSGPDYCGRDLLSARVSTRRMEKLVETLGISHLSKSHVSVMACELDAHGPTSSRSPPMSGGTGALQESDGWSPATYNSGRRPDVSAAASGVRRC
jgi:putative transposase